MIQRLAIGLCLLLSLSTMAYADEVLVMDNFDSYTDASFTAAWPLQESNAPDEFGLVVPRMSAPFPPSPWDGLGDAGTTPPSPPAMGQAITFNNLSYLHERALDDMGNPVSASPSPTQAVRVTGDIFDFVQGNRRFSVGLRSSSPANLLEMGFYNADAFDPTDPLNCPPNSPTFDLPTTGYAYRLQLWPTVGGTLQCNPNWQYFPLPIEFDDPIVDHNGDGRVGNGDGLVSPIDVGPGWHTYSATITEETVTLTLDLFRDGTVDSIVEWEIGYNGDPFDSLRMGSPSGSLSMNEFTMADNIKLELIDLASTIDGDFDGNGAYECNDVDQLVSAIVDVKNGGVPDLNFDLTQDGNVNDDDLTAWRTEAGAGVVAPPLTASGNPVQLGDATLDGVVDGLDFIEWNASKFTSVAAWCSGDFNADGVIDGLDFILWNDNKFTSADHVAVPEPSAILLCLCAALLLSRAPRRAG
jgi:hypothetical protein